jgi:hypothetical protein
MKAILLSSAFIGLRIFSAGEASAGRVPAGDSEPGEAQRRA